MCAPDCFRRLSFMAYCRNCGSQIDDQVTTCPVCGAAQSAAPTPPQPQQQQQQQAPQVVDNGGFGWGLLGCCIPLVGLILFLVWKDQKPKTAKMAGIGALISVAGGVILYILMAILGVGLGLMGL